MAPLSTIPTSFVPHPASSPRRFRTDFTGAFAFFAYAVFAVVFALACGVFFYGRILAANKSAKDAALAKTEAALDPATVQDFVRLHDRLKTGDTLLQNHVSFRAFFTALETVLPTNVRLKSLHISIDSAGIAKVEGSGIAKSFNALSAASAAFSAEKDIKDVIFSKISINKDSSVSFTLSAVLGPGIITFSP